MMYYLKTPQSNCVIPYPGKTMMPRNLALLVPSLLCFSSAVHVHVIEPVYRDHLCLKEVNITTPCCFLLDGPYTCMQFTLYVSAS